MNFIGCFLELFKFMMLGAMIVSTTIPVIWIQNLIGFSAFFFLIIFIVLREWEREYSLKEKV